MDQSPNSFSPHSLVQESPTNQASTDSHPDLHSPAYTKPKQKRNKPTLSCLECVEHKTKCDRGRPQCLACLKRSSKCQYSSIANILSVSDGKRGKHRKLNKPEISFETIEKCSIANITHPTPHESASPHVSPSSVRPVSIPSRTESGRRSIHAQSDPVPLLTFGADKEHPFANYWTCNGGLAEVIAILPSKDQADILVEKFFEIVDPINPVLGDRSLWLDAYEQFWALSHLEKCKCDGALVGLHFVIYAIATQYIELPSGPARTRTAEFYISAAHQALKISSYLNKVTITTVQAMSLIFYFLVNDNHISEAWTFSGITQRQAYAVQLYRDPDIVVPLASSTEKSLRCMLWSVLVYQEVGIAIQLKFPSTSTHSDVVPHSFKYEYPEDHPGTHHFHETSLNGNRLARSALIEDYNNDISFCRSSLAYSRFCQDHLCRARALDLPLCKSNEHRSELMLAARSLYRSFPRPFGSYDPNRFVDASRRLARQQITLTQSFFHTVMWICADENLQGDVACDFYGTLEAAHEALYAFFALDSIFADEPSSWWRYLIRAFEEVMLMAKLLAAEQKPVYPPLQGSSAAREYNIVLNAKEDILRILDILRHKESLPEFKEAQKARYETLRKVYNNITII